MEPCPDCAGNGVVPYQKRKLENGEDDPADFRICSLCERCGGSGMVPVDKARIREPGHIADMSG